MLMSDASAYQNGLEPEVLRMLDDEAAPSSSRSISAFTVEGSSSQSQEPQGKKGSKKGKEKAEDSEHVQVKEEPISLQLSDLPAIQVSALILVSLSDLILSSQTRTIAHRVARWAPSSTAMVVHVPSTHGVWIRLWIRPTFRIATTGGIVLFVGGPR